MEKVSRLKVMVFALALTLLSLPVLLSAEDEGCVACHTGPLALSTLLPEKVTSHPDIWDEVNMVPTYCSRCHVKDTEMALMDVIHPSHEGVECGNCHTVDENSVPTAIKTGAKNW